MPDAYFMEVMRQKHEARRITITGNQLKACRILAGLTQTDLTRLSGIGRNTYLILRTKITTGRNIPLQPS